MGINKGRQPSVTTSQWSVNPFLNRYIIEKIKTNFQYLPFLNTEMEQVFDPTAVENKQPFILYYTISYM